MAGSGCRIILYFIYSSASPKQLNVTGIYQVSGKVLASVVDSFHQRF